MFRILPLALVLVACNDVSDASDAASVVPVVVPAAVVPPTVAEPTVADSAPVAPPVENGKYILRDGETLDDFAKWSGLTVEQIAQASNLDLSGRYPVGTSLVLPVDASTQASVAAKRESVDKARVERFIDQHGLVGTTPVVVHTGDSAWSIARAEDVPMSVLSAANPGIDLDKVRPGQVLQVPTAPTPK